MTLYLAVMCYNKFIMAEQRPPLTESLADLNGGVCPSIWAPEQYSSSDRLAEIQSRGGYLLILHTLKPDKEPMTRTIVGGNRPDRLLETGSFMSGDRATTFLNVPVALVWARHGEPCTNSSLEGYKTIDLEYPKQETVVIHGKLLGTRSDYRGPYWPEIDEGRLCLRKTRRDDP